jgi:hypothetical protein
MPVPSAELTRSAGAASSRAVRREKQFRHATLTWPELDRPFTPIVWVIAPAAILGCLYLFSSLTSDTIKFFLPWNVAGALVYFLCARRRSKLAQAGA